VFADQTDSSGVAVGVFGFTADRGERFCHFPPAKNSGISDILPPSATQRSSSRESERADGNETMTIHPPVNDAPVQRRSGSATHRSSRRASDRRGNSTAESMQRTRDRSRRPTAQRDHRRGSEMLPRDAPRRADLKRNVPEGFDPGPFTEPAVAGSVRKAPRGQILFAFTRGRISTSRPRCVGRWAAALGDLPCPNGTPVSKGTCLSRRT